MGYLEGKWVPIGTIRHRALMSDDPSFSIYFNRNNLCKVLNFYNGKTTNSLMTLENQIYTNELIKYSWDIWFAKWIYWEALFMSNVHVALQSRSGKGFMLFRLGKAWMFQLKDLKRWLRKWNGQSFKCIRNFSSKIYQHFPKNICHSIIIKFFIFWPTQLQELVKKLVTKT